MDKPKAIAIGASLLALAAAFPEVYGKGDWDSGLAVLTLTLIALVWYTFFTYQAVTLDDGRRKQQRRSWAAILLKELDRIRPELVKMAALSGNPRPGLPIRSPLLNEGVRHADVLGSPAAETISSLSGSLSTLLELVHEYNAPGSMQTGSVRSQGDVLKLMRQEGGRALDDLESLRAELSDLI